MQEQTYYAYVDNIEENEDDKETAYVTFDCVTTKSSSYLQGAESYEQYLEWLQKADISIVQNIVPLPAEYLKVINSISMETAGWLIITLSDIENDAPVSVHSLRGTHIGDDGIQLYLTLEGIAQPDDIMDGHVSMVNYCMNLFISDYISQSKPIQPLKFLEFYNDTHDKNVIEKTSSIIFGIDFKTAIILLKALRDLQSCYIIEARCFNVGQGNLASLIDENGSVAAYLDFGASCYFNSASRPCYMKTQQDLITTIGYDVDNPAPVILSHYDADHYFAARLISTLPNSIQGLWLLPNDCPMPQGHGFNKFLTSLANPVFMDWGQSGNRNTLGKLEIQSVLSNIPYDRNNNSIAVIVSLPDQKRALFSADIDYSMYPLSGYDYDYLIASHHGGKLHGNAYGNWPNVPTPKSKKSSQLIYSVGLNNVYNHPLTMSRCAHYQHGWEKDTETWRLNNQHHYSLT